MKATRKGARRRSAPPCAGAASATPRAKPPREKSAREKSAREKSVKLRRDLQARFLDALAESSNVLGSARAAGVAEATIYDWRAADEGFRALWDRALDSGYARLEMELLRRALEGTEKDVYYAGEKTGTVRDYDNRLAITLLKAHHDRIAAIRAAREAAAAAEADAAKAEREADRNGAGSRDAAAEIARLADRLKAQRDGQAANCPEPEAPSSAMETDAPLERKSRRAGRASALDAPLPGFAFPGGAVPATPITLRDALRGAP